MKRAVLLFDLDDTLYAERLYVDSGLRAVAHEAETRHGLGYEASISVMRAGDNAFDALHAVLPQMDIAEMLHVYRTHKPDISLADDVRDTLGALRARGFRLGIITDGRSIGQRNKILALGLDRMIDYLSISEEIGADKLSALPFVKAMDYFGQDSRYIYIGDNPAKDFFHANALRWCTVMIKESGANCNVHSQDLSGLGHEYLPDFIIDSLASVGSIAERCDI